MDDGDKGDTDEVAEAQGAEGTEPGPITHHADGEIEVDDRTPAVRDDEVGRDRDRAPEAVEGRILDGEDVSEQATLAALISQVSHWSGMLPRPEDLAMYPPHVQDKILAWQDAAILEESARQTAESNAVIRWGDRGQILAGVFLGLSLTAAFICAVLGLDWKIVAAFLAAPVMGLLAMLLPNPWRSKS